MSELTTRNRDAVAPRMGETPLPTAVIEFAGADGSPAGLPVVAAGQPFGLSGARSSGVGPARVVAYVWTLLPE